MKAALIHIAIGVAAFLGGAVCAVYVLMELDLEIDRQLDMLRFSSDFAPEIDVATHLYQIQAAQEERIEWLIMSNCVRMSHQLKLVNPQIFEGQRRDDVEALVEEAYETFQELNKQGLCGAPLREGAN